MTARESIEVARAYVALSNAHRVDLIEPMLARRAVYRSSAVGEYLGREAILGMMRSFFSDFPDVGWQCGDFDYTDSIVSFEFVLRATSAKTGEAVQRAGHEHIEFDAAGLIRSIRVEVA